MTFRGRLITGFLVVALVPLGVLTLGVRREMQTQVIALSARRTLALATVAAADMAELHATIGNALAPIARALPDDSRFRAEALRSEPGDRGYLIDHAATAMRSAGLSMLQIRNDSGRILSSGHFPAEFDRVDPDLPVALRSESALTLVNVRTAEGSLTVAARVDSFTIAGRLFTIVGGRTVDQSFIDALPRGDEIGAELTLPGTVLRSRASTAASYEPSSADPAAIVLRTLGIPYIDATTTPISSAEAELSIVRRFDEGRVLQRTTDRWILVAFLLATVLALLSALWLAARLSRPMEDLAAATATVDLDRLDVRFAAGRDDEIGVLSRRLTAMVDRLRGSAARLREAERRATVGEIARQVNHDIKNGLAPIRNVVRHLAQVAHDRPAELPAIFTARQRTLESSIGYLETLAQNYARLSPSLAARPTDIESIIAEVIGASQRPGAELRATTARGLPLVLADAVVVRRILENLVGNAVDSLEGKPGEVAVGAEAVTIGERGAPPGAPLLVRLSVRDSGKGMTEAELARAFDDFYTTKPHGTGLGLSVVRRLVADLGGSLRIETEPGVGTQVQVDLPAASATDRAARTTPTGAR